MTCDRCGAISPVGADWCGQCHVRFDASPELSPGARSRLASISPATVAAPQKFSRWKASETSFGPIGKLAITVVVLAVAGWLVVVANLDPLPAIVWCGLFAPWILRDLWRRHRVR